ncbi:hexosaminidase D-like [Diadema setosum]|uniref:hexosaminidase D-like n=1 Tax=Diadema setosum TaxID=31175 RepID=UPI003B3A227D
MDAEIDIYGTPSQVQPPLPDSYQRLVHVDLKGAPPKIDYLLKILPLFKEWGATGLLVEYEDTFPFSRDLQIISKREECYSLGDIASLQQAAKGLSLEYIPLIQTFGHLEFVLKHAQFHSLREDPEDARSVCPSNPDSLKLVQSMLDQVLEYHPEVKYFHIGADEVWMKRRCQKCIERIQETFHGKPSGLFLSHVKAVLGYLQERCPNIRPIMWDDMLRGADCGVVKDSNLGDMVDVMVWNYLDTMASFNMTTPQKVWQLYGSVFKNVWIASAFKGAFGPTLFLTPELEHIRNQELWVNELQRAVPKQLDFKGIVFTGWQRYTHQTVLCELLPVGLPSLAFCLETFIQGYFKEEIHQAVSQKLGFPELLDLEIQTSMPISEMPVDVPMGTFPGSAMYMCARQLAMLQSSKEGQQFFKLPNQSAFLTEAEEASVSAEKACLMLPALTDSEMGPVLSLLARATRLKTRAQEALSEVYHPPTINEWLELCIMPLIKHLERRLAETKEQNQ